MNLLDNVKIIRALNVQSTAQAGSTSKAIDTKGFEGCLFIAVGSSLTCGSTPTMRIKTAASTTATFGVAATKNQPGASLVVTGSFDRKVFATDVYRPLKRYLKGSVIGATSGTIRTMLAILYGPRRPGSSACDSTTVNKKTLAAATS